MLAEIHEQPSAAADTRSHWREQADSGDGELLLAALLQNVERVVIVGCGSSYHAGLAGRLAIERWARVPVEVEIASEFRYRDPILPPRTLVLAISESGEAVETLAAMRLARARGAIVVAVTNTPGSEVTRRSDAVLYTRAGAEAMTQTGPEDVTQTGPEAATQTGPEAATQTGPEAATQTGPEAATGAFIPQVVLLYALAFQLAEIRSSQPAAALSELGAALELLPGQVASVLASSGSAVRCS
jgi:glucosamine--fructose-6-phosphate aminotransferase (isomerizing)